MKRYRVCLLLSLLGLGALAHAAVTVESPSTALVFDRQHRLKGCSSVLVEMVSAGRAAILFI